MLDQPPIVQTTTLPTALIRGTIPRGKVRAHESVARRSEMR